MEPVGAMASLLDGVAMALVLVGVYSNENPAGEHLVDLSWYLLDGKMCMRRCCTFDVLVLSCMRLGEGICTPDLDHSHLLGNHFLQTSCITCGVSCGSSVHRSISPSSSADIHLMFESFLVQLQRLMVDWEIFHFPSSSSFLSSAFSLLPVWTLQQRNWGDSRGDSVQSLPSAAASAVAAVAAISAAAAIVAAAAEAAVAAVASAAAVVVVAAAVGKRG